MLPDVASGFCVECDISERFTHSDSWHSRLAFRCPSPAFGTTFAALIGAEERIAALETIELKQTKDRTAELDMGRSAGGGATESRSRNGDLSPDMEKTQTPKSVDSGLYL